MMNIAPSVKAGFVPVAWPRRCFCIVIACLVLAGCALTRTQLPARIALLAPFESRYREIGYNALYPARLAFMDVAVTRVELLAVDDGGSVESAVDRARALALDPLVKLVIVIGYDAAAPEVQRALDNLPVIIVGQWMVEPVVDRVFVISSPQILEMLSHNQPLSITEAADVEAPFVGGEVFGLEAFPKLREDLGGITVISSGELPDETFIQRILASDQFASRPGLLATTVYDATRLAIEAVSSADINRAEVQQRLADMVYIGLTGTIQFDTASQYRLDAPIFHYRFDGNRRLFAFDP